jgi:hypothetical protein
MKRGNYLITMQQLTLSLLALTLLFGACTDTVPLLSGQGKRPIYIPLSELDNIGNLPPQNIVQSGPIFLRDTLFFMVEQGRGIHVFDVSDPNAPVAVTFFEIPAVTNFTLSGDRLFADSWRDLVTIDISDILAIRKVDRLEDAFSPLLYPPLYNGIFECIDESRGAVAGWEDAALKDVACRTVN